MAVAACGGPSQEDRVAACAQTGYRIDSDECAQEFKRQQANTACIADYLGGDDNACADEDKKRAKPASAADLESQIKTEVQQQFGVGIDSIECGGGGDIKAGAVVKCPFEAAGQSATILATIRSLGPPIKVTVDVDESGEPANNAAGSDEDAPAPTAGNEATGESAVADELPPTASAGTSNCGEAAGGAATMIQARDTSCAGAHAVARAIVLGEPGVRCAERNGIGGFDPCRWRGYTCRSKPRESTARYSCDNGQRRVYFSVRVEPSSGSE